MKTARKAVVLCAGYGTRLHPLTATTPKPLIPLWDTPNLTHILRTLQTWGVRDVLLNLHHVPEPLLHYAVSNPVPGLRLNLSYEADILGTGGALRKAEWFLAGNDPLWVVNADILPALDPRPLLRLLSLPRTLAALWVDAHAGPRTVECPRNVVTTFRSKRAGSPGTFTFCGLQLIDPRLLRYLPQGTFATLVEAYERARADGWHIRTHAPPDGLWCDLGTPEGLLQAHALVWQRRPASVRMAKIQRTRRAALRAAGVTLKGFVAIGADCHVAPTACLENTVLCSGTRVGHGAQVHDAIVAADVPARARVSRFLTPAPPDPVIKACIDAMGWRPEHVQAEHLAHRASSRRFTRLHHGTSSVMLVEYDAKRIENTRYVSHARFLRRHQIRVPDVLLDRPRQSFTLFEDLGHQSLLECLPREAPHKRWTIYGPVIRAVAHWHNALACTRGAPARGPLRGLSLEPAFDADLYHWEQELFCEHFLGHRHRLSPMRMAPLHGELNRLRDAMLAQPACLVHRDLQSSNIYRLGTSATPEIAFIDFQGMRQGSPYYDLGSLLCDPYVSMPLRWQEHWVRDYARGVDTDPTPALQAFWTASLQRLLQAIGAFARNARNPATRAFEAHLPAALRMLERVCVRLDKYPHLNDLMRGLRDGATPCTGTLDGKGSR